MTQVVETNECLYRGTLRFYSQGTIGVSTDRIVNKELQNKYCYLEDSDTMSIYNVFDSICYRTYINPNYCSGDPIYIHPKARLSRDLIRQSKYTITRNPDKAVFVVIPQPNYYEFAERSYNIACVSKESLYLFTVSHDFNISVSNEKFDDAKERIKDYLSDNDVTFISDDLSLKRCVFFPKIDAYKDLALSGYSDRKYVFDTKLQLEPSVDISVETLDVWRRIDDMNMLSRFICASNWKEYPFTLKTFLNAECWDIRYQSNNNIKMILQEIKFNARNSDDELVSKKDYDMLISYIYHRLGRPVGPTYVTDSELNQIPNDYQRFFKKRVAIAPKTIDNDETYGNIVAQK